MVGRRVVTRMAVRYVTPASTHTHAHKPMTYVLYNMLKVSSVHKGLYFVLVFSDYNQLMNQPVLDASFPLIYWEVLLVPTLIYLIVGEQAV